MIFKYLVLTLLAISLIGISDSYAQITDDAISVTTDKSFYSEGETIVIFGEVRDLYSGTPVSVIVTDPYGELVSIIQVEVGNDKKFITEMTAGGALMQVSGTYIVTAQYGTVNRSDTTTFEFGGSTTVTPPSQVKSSGLQSIVRSMIVDDDALSIIFSMNVDKSGLFTTDIPRNVLDATMNGRDIDFIVLVDGENVQYTETKNSIYRKLTIPYTSGTEEIEIVGTNLGYNETINEEFVPIPIPSSEKVSDLKKLNTELKLENRQLKQKITSLQDEIEELKDLLVNGLKEIYKWKSNE